MGHKQRDCPMATRIGRERKVRETKRARIEKGLSLHGVVVPNDKVSKSSQVHESTSSGKCKCYSLWRKLVGWVCFDVL